MLIQYNLKHLKIDKNKFISFSELKHYSLLFFTFFETQFLCVNSLGNNFVD